MHGAQGAGRCSINPLDPIFLLWINDNEGRDTGRQPHSKCQRSLQISTPPPPSPPTNKTRTKAPDQPGQPKQKEHRLAGWLTGPASSYSALTEGPHCSCPGSATAVKESLNLSSSEITVNKQEWNSLSGRQFGDVHENPEINIYIFDSTHKN